MKKILIITLISGAITFGLTAQALISVDESNQSNISQPVKMRENAPALKPVEIYFFKTTGCPYCASLETYLNSLQAEFPTLTIKKFDLRAEPQSIALCQKLAASCNANIDSVPMTFIGKDMIIGDRQTEIRQKIELCVAVGCPSPLENININTNNTNINTNDTNEKKSFAGYIILGILGVALGGLIIFISRKRG